MATEAQPAAPASQTVRPATFDWCFRWRWGHQGGSRATVVHERFVLFRIESDFKHRVWLLSRTKAALLSFLLSIDPSFERSVGSGTCATGPQQDWGRSWSWGKLERSSKQSTRQFQVPNYSINMINTTVRKVVFRSHFVKCKCHGPPPCACKFRLHARACRNIVGVQRHASLVTSKIGPVKIMHCDQRKRHVGISNILNQTNYSNELDAKRTSEYSVNSFQHYLKEPLMHQSRRAHLFCDPPRRMAISVHGTNEGGGFCKQEACGAPCVCATCLRHERVM